MVFGFYELILTALVGIVSIAAFHDVRSQRIPNLVTYPTIGAAFFSYCLYNSFSGLLFSLGGLAVGLGIAMGPYLLGGVGAGDVKLIGAIGATVGAKAVIIVTFLAALAGGVYIILLASIRWRYLVPRIASFARTLWTHPSRSGRSFFSDTGQCSKLKLRYGVPIASGTFAYTLNHFLQVTSL